MAVCVDWSLGVAGHCRGYQRVGAGIGILAEEQPPHCLSMGHWGWCRVLDEGRSEYLFPYTGAGCFSTLKHLLGPQLSL